MCRASHDYDEDQGRRQRLIFVAFWSTALIVTAVVFHAVLLPFILAAIIAYILSPVVGRVSLLSVRGRQLPRWIAVLVLYVFVLSALYGSVRLAVPVLSTEIRDFARNEVPRLTNEVRTRWLPRLRSLNERFSLTTAARPSGSESGLAEPVGEDSLVRIEPQTGGGYRVAFPNEGLAIQREGSDRYRVLTPKELAEDRRDHLGVLIEQARVIGAGHTEDILRVGRGILGSIVSGIFLFFMTVMLSAYMLVTEDRILGFISSLVHPARRPRFDELLHRIDRGLSGVVRGQLIICGVNGILSAVGFAIAGLNYWPLFALMAGVFSLIPIFGSIVSGFLAVVFGLFQSVGTGSFVFFWIIGIHQLEANLLNPKIMGDQAKIHPVLVFFSLLAGEHFFGIVGALLAVPIMSITQSVFLHWRKYSLSYGDPRVVRDSFTPPEMPRSEQVASVQPDTAGPAA